MKGLLRQLMEVASVPDLDDLPILGPFDLQRLRRLSSKYVKMINEYWADIVKEKRASKDHSRNNFLDVLIQADFTDAQINALFLDIFGPGSDTNSCTIEWAMSELIKNPDKLFKLEDELANVIGHGREVRDFHLENLLSPRVYKGDIEIAPAVSIPSPSQGNRDMSNDELHHS
ncbi:hypothetical protein Scep_005135 [Stephania cephalantha]|uniref:Cytochrome P450 76AD1-like protein n=1 Tax=Stephania cephalantha TaxID=152367 RepID=A0AAP0PZT2_9MAGN